jgi:23S rRNA (pseudouridine1915-N3)-methyltransferase
MQISIFAHGKIPNSPELELIERYMKRFNEGSSRCSLTTLDIKEINTEGIDYNKKILGKATSEKNYLVLDEKGEQISSHELAKYLDNLSVNGLKRVLIFIGGAHGLPEIVKKNALKSISFSRMVLPHKLIRVILTEQLYRSKCILMNHPYHKE